MRFLGTWAVAVACAAVLSVPGCLTSQENPGDRGRVNDPPVRDATGGKKGRGGSGGTNGLAGEDSGGTSSGRAGRGGGSGTGTGDGGADSGCSDDADCDSRIDDRARCSVPTGECVRCLSAADCGDDEECVNNDCRPIITCATSEECPHNLVCNPATDRCVQCVGSNGCAAGELCVGNTCRQPCSTDSQCIFFGLRCDVRAGYCASCISDDDCPASQNCQAGSCVRDICVGGSASCEGNSLASCNEAGSQLNNPIACPAQQTCTEDSRGARCEPWICQPGTTGCSRTTERVVTCSDDGLEETLVEDCEAQSMLCIGTVGGVCTDALCEPNEIFCQGDTRQLCNADGTASTLVQTCATTQRCDQPTATCINQICTPGQPACDGNVFTTCDAEGFGYTGARTDCTRTGESCGPTGCTASVVDTIPASPTLYSSALSNYAMLNFYSVSSSRSLTLIEGYMSPSSATTLTWLVFESTTQTGTYTNISSTMTTSGTGTGYQASGTLNVPLVAGRYYAIGYSWTSPALLFGFQQTTASQTVSFGALIGAYFPTPPPAAPFAGTSMTTASFVPQRLTTAP